MDDQADSSKSSENTKWIKTVTDLSLTNLIPECVSGAKLGSGTIVELIGEGGMARVFKTWNEDLEMSRAVKVMLPSTKKEVADRFVTEARITARLNHPNIVLVYGVGEWKGYHFIEMEYIDGFPLDKLLTQRKSFPAYVSCAICVLIAKALCYAHLQKFTLYSKEYKGIIHRDLKPGNVMLHKDGRLKLMDFGIARPISTGFHTMGENIVGTLQYLSPEQLSHTDIDHRTDIYAVGAIFYELLSGIKAFPDEGLTDLVNKKSRGIYKPVIEFPVEIPAIMSDIVDKCLQVNQNDRYQDAASLLDALTTAYNQCTCEQLETALQNYLNDSHYIPALPDRSPQKKHDISSQTRNLSNNLQEKHNENKSQYLIGIMILVLALSTMSGFLFFSKNISFKHMNPSKISASSENLDMQTLPVSTSEKNMISIDSTSSKLSASYSSLPDQSRSAADTVHVNSAKNESASMNSLKSVIVPDQYEIAVKALQNGDLFKAYIEIGKIDSDNPRKIDLQMDLIDRCLTSGDMEHAEKLVFSIKSDAARFHLLRGRVFSEKEEFDKALTEYENAMFASTGNKNARFLKSDIIFYQANSYEKIYRKNNVPEARLTAIRYWRQVQKFYAETPKHPRYILATGRIQNL